MAIVDEDRVNVSINIGDKTGEIRTKLESPEGLQNITMVNGIKCFLKVKRKHVGRQVRRMGIGDNVSKERKIGENATTTNGTSLVRVDNMQKNGGETRSHSFSNNFTIST